MNGNSVIPASGKKQVPVYGHPNLSHPENHKPDLRPVGHKGTITSNMVLQHIRFAVTRLETAKEESLCDTAANHLGAWNNDIDSVIEILKRVLTGECLPDRKFISRTDGWIREDISAA